MPSSTLRRRIVPALVLTVMTGTWSVAASPPSSAAEPAAASSAATWLAGQLTQAGTVVGSFPDATGLSVTYTDYGRTLDAALALLAAGGHDDVLGIALTSVSTPNAVREYTRGAPADRPDAAYAGATAKLALVVEATGGDATDVGGVDLLAQLESLVATNGRLADRSSFGNYANLFGHGFALLALDTAGRAVPDNLVAGLLAAQCQDGSFPETYEPAAGVECTGSVDATGLVLQALAAVDRGGSDEGQAAAAWLAGWQSNDDGSFPAEAPVNATGYAAMGLQAIGRDTTRAASYLASQQNDDGGLRRGSGPSTASDAFATSQALPALVGTTFQGAARDVARLPVPCAAAVASLPQSTITVGIRGVVRVRGTSGTVVGLYAYSQPATTYRLVRTFTLGRDGTGSVAVAPGTNTRLYAQQRGCDAGASTVLSVRTALTLTATRNSVRDYTFSGTSAPTRARGLVVSIYRITADGSAVLAGQTRASATTGRWTFRRTFSGTGRFGFVARTAPDIQNAGGSSAVRSVQIS